MGASFLVSGVRRAPCRPLAQPTLVRIQHPPQAPPASELGIFSQRAEGARAAMVLLPSGGPVQVWSRGDIAGRLERRGLWIATGWQGACQGLADKRLLDPV